MRYCKSTIFQANHNNLTKPSSTIIVVCDTAKVRFFKQITTPSHGHLIKYLLFAILQKYDFSSKSQHAAPPYPLTLVVCDTAKVRFFKQITTDNSRWPSSFELFAILQKYDFSSKSQLISQKSLAVLSCLRYCKSTIFQANHNKW